MRTWSSLDKFTAIEMIRNGGTNSQVAAKLGRSLKSVENWLKRQRGDGYNFRILSLNRDELAATEGNVIPPFVIADLDRRMSIAPTLDHVLLGTPLPTCSALDRPANLYYAR